MLVLFQANILSGITLLPWLRVLSRNLGGIDWIRYGPRLVFVTALSIFNTGLAIIEYLLHGRAIASVQLNPRPVFILGHPRTGTTHLFNLISQDDERFVTCTTFHCGFPSCFLWFRRFKTLLASMVPSVRPMDNMKLGMDTPQVSPLPVGGRLGGG